MRAAFRCIVVALAALALCAPVAAATSSSTAALQVALAARGLYTGTIDGIRGPGTDGAVRAFQARGGLLVDGIAGPQTRGRLGWRGRPSLGRRVLRAGRRGWDVAALQFLLGTHGFPSGAMDGGLGPRTEAALRRFQAWAGLAVDGVAGPATLVRLRKPPPTSPLVFALPVPAPAGDRFGPRGDRFHTGVDFPVRGGTPVAAAGRGCVSFAGPSVGGYGKLVVIQHRLGVTSWYGHLSAITVARGRCVLAGDRIGRAGATGRATGPHVHLELRLRGAAVPPRF